MRNSFFEHFYRVVGTEAAKLVAAEIRNINKKLDKILMTLQERFDALNAGLDEASTEILAELAALRAGGSLTTEQEASLARAEAKVGALKDVSPAVPPPEG